MRYSLLSRFQGALLGAALGNELGDSSWSGQRLAPEGKRAAGQGALLVPATLAHWHPGITSEKSLSSTCASPWGSAATSCAHALVRTGRWNELEMAAIGVRFAAGRMAADTVLEQPRASLIAAECTLATLPIALFFHDNASKQQQRLVETVRLWQCPPGTEAGLLAVGYAIAQALQDRVEQLSLVPQTITYLKQSTANPTAPLLDLMDALEQVQALLQQGAGLLTAIEQLRVRGTHLGNRAIALAFYCFLSTPDELHLAVLRAARSGEAAPLVCALTGALSGVHNSLSGLPLAWRMGGSIRLWGVSEQEMHQLAAHLVGVWSGVYDPEAATNAVAIAAPGVIRPR